MWFLYLSIGGALLYVAVLSITSLVQTKLLFPAQIAAANRPDLPPSAERLEVTTPDGERLVGVRFRGSSESQPRLLGFGGNAWNAESMALYLHGLFPDREIVVFHYRGYPPSSGEPGAKALMDDALTVFDHLQR